MVQDNIAPNAVDLPRFKCDFEGCGTTFSDRRCLLRHIDRFNHILNSSCPMCSIKFENDELLRIHKMENHLVPKVEPKEPEKIVKVEPKKEFKCSEEGCNSSYKRKQHLIRHVAQTHQIPVKPFKCEHPGCFASFDNLISLIQHRKCKRHVGNSNKGSKKHRCEESGCNEGFNFRWQLKEHSIVHTKDIPFKCEKCPMEFQFFSSYKIHLPVHDIPKPYMCSKCFSLPQFNILEEYEDHLTKKHSNIPKSKIERDCQKCEECGKSFASMKILIEHKKTHTAERKIFNCPYDECKKFYYHKKNVISHVTREHEKKTFECSICEKKLSSKQRLDFHFKSIHSEEKGQRNRKKTDCSRAKLLTKLVNGNPSPAGALSVKKTGPKSKRKSTDD